MPNPFLHIPVCILLFPVGILQIAQTGGTPGRTFRHAWFAATLAYAATLYWVAIPVHNFGYITPKIQVPWIIAAFCPLLLGTYLGLFPAIFALLLFKVKIPQKNWFALGIFAGLAWTCLELVRGILFTGFPWLDLPTAFVPWSILLQHLRFWGVPGATVLFVSAAVWIYTGIKNQNYHLPFIISALLFGFITFDGYFRITNNTPEEKEKYTIRLVQGNIPQQKKWLPTQQKQEIDTYLKLSKGKGNEPDLIIWPETAVPFYLQANNELSLEVRAYAAAKRLYMLVGSPAYEEKDGNFQLYNSAFLISSFGDIVKRYDKQHLVPFGEYIPLQHLFPFLNTFNNMQQNFSSGTQTAPLNADRLALGVLICYESIFSNIAQNLVKSGCNVFVNISNDAWFDKSSAPLQHLHAASLRCIEQNRYLLRATNTGISAFVDNTGTIIAKTELFKATELTRSLPLIREKTTFYHRNYSWLIPAFPILFMLFLWQLPRIKRRKWKTGSCFHANDNLKSKQ